MKIELLLPPELVETIAGKVIERLKPHLVCRCKQQDDEILTIEQVSRLLCKSKAQIYQWVNLSKHGLNNFPYLKAGKSLRFSKNKLLQWLQNR
jgi:predicted DNA-binding transcriptional regulator AlpA